MNELVVQFRSGAAGRRLIITVPLVVNHNVSRRWPRQCQRACKRDSDKWKSGDEAGARRPCYRFGVAFLGACSALKPLLSVMYFAIAAGFVFAGS